MPAAESVTVVGAYQLPLKPEPVQRRARGWETLPVFLPREWTWTVRLPSLRRAPTARLQQGMLASSRVQVAPPSVV